MQQSLRPSHGKPIPAVRALSTWLLSGCLLAAGNVWADTITVDSTADDGSGCTLREAIENANTDSGGNGCAAGSGDDIIVFDSPVSGVITLDGTELSIESNIDIKGPGANALSVDADNKSSVFVIALNAEATIDRLTISVGVGLGGIRNLGLLHLSNANVSNNSSSRPGGGIANDGAMTIDNSTVSDNSATFGGGISNTDQLTVNNSTVSNNSATKGGGGIYNTGDVTVNNSTLSNNTGSHGGGVFNTNTATLNHATVSDNIATKVSGGIYNKPGTLALNATIVANSTNGDCFNGGTVNASNSLLMDTGLDACNLTNGVDNNIIGSDPLLDPLADNGGATQTHALQDGSPAIDASDNTTCSTPPINNKDQRRFTRNDGACDIGAFEVDARAPLGHFLFYSIKPDAKLPRFGPVKLMDQFGTLMVNVSLGRRLGLPADKNGEGIVDAVSHLFEYTIKPTKGAERFQAQTNVLVDNQCGSYSVTVRRPRSLLLPTGKSHDTAALPPVPTSLDHFLCYDVKLEGQRLPKGLQVTVSDQFQSDRRYDLKKITKLCTPVDKSGNPTIHKGPNRGTPFPITPATIGSPDEHLLCYQAKPAKTFVPQDGCGFPNGIGQKFNPRQAKHTSVTVAIANQFETNIVASKAEAELCIPSTMPR